MEIAALKPQLPIILCTGYNDVSEEQKQKLTSIKTILQKPVSLRILSQTVRDVIDSH
jgi:DNA-binding NtrC family response regulator